MVFTSCNNFTVKSYWPHGVALFLLWAFKAKKQKMSGKKREMRRRGKTREERVNLMNEKSSG